MLYFTYCFAVYCHVLYNWGSITYGGAQTNEIPKISEFHNKISQNTSANLDQHIGSDWELEVEVVLKLCRRR